MTSKTKLVRANEIDLGAGESFVITSADSDGRMEWIEGIIGFGQGPVYHIHHNADELFIVYSGELKLKVDGELIDLGPGDVMWVPRGVAHTYTNVNPDQPVRLGAAYTPAGLQEFLSFWNELIADGMPDEATLAEIEARYGQQALGPPLAVELGLFQQAGT